MRRKTVGIGIICLITIAAVAIISGTLGKKPFKDLDAAEIESASVLLGPPDQTIQMVETKELVEYLKDIVIYGKDNSYTEYAGQTCIFTIVKTDGTELQVTAFNPFIIIDGVGYKCKYEPCETLNHYANSLLSG